MYKLYIAILFFFIQTISAQQLRQPFDFPILLSGNFGELRNNHFHSGIDFKTQGVEGKPIRTERQPSTVICNDSPLPSPDISRHSNTNRKAST